jgi:hypothetical protein
MIGSNGEVDVKKIDKIVEELIYYASQAKPRMVVYGYNRYFTG